MREVNGRRGGGREEERQREGQPLTRTRGGGKMMLCGSAGSPGTLKTSSGAPELCSDVRLHSKKLLR